MIEQAIKIVVFCIVIILSAVSIFSYYKYPRKYKYFKLFPVLTLIIYLLISIVLRKRINIFNMCILTGLCCCLTGDYLLLKDDLFIYGLGAFLIGHLFYLFSFRSIRYDMNPAVIIILLLISIIFNLILFYKMDAALRRKFIWPVIFYNMVITHMVLFAINFSVNHFDLCVMYIIGAVLFYISDMILAWDKFVKKYKYSYLFILLTYYLAQIFITFNTIAIL